MNYIVLEGFSLYFSLVLVFLLVLLSIGCLLYAILADKRNFANSEMLKREMEKNQILIRANMKLILKYGEFDRDD